MLKSLIFALAFAFVGCKPDPQPASTEANLLSDGGPVVTYSGLPWPRSTIAPGSTVGAFRGADGVDLRSDASGLHIATAWEEGGTVSVSDLAPGGNPLLPWTTTAIATGVAGVEDAKFGDFDGDGLADVASASDSGGRVYIHFRNASPPYTTVTLTNSLGHGRWMQLAAVDINADGLLDIAAGGRTAGGAVAWFENPGAGARTGGAWTYHHISAAGWIMSLIALDVDGDSDQDLVVSDRASISGGTPTVWSLYGARWLENLGGSWANHNMEVAGGCGTCTPGDEMMLALHDWTGDGRLDVTDGQSSGTKPNRVAIHPNPGWTVAAPWPTTLIPSGNVNWGVGHYQSSAIGDVDKDGAADMVISSWEVNGPPCSGVPNACSTLVGIYWLRNLGSNTWQHYDISGPEGSKFDNVLLVDLGRGVLDVVVSEQVDQLGNVVYANPYPSM